MNFRYLKRLEKTFVIVFLIGFFLSSFYLVKIFLGDLSKAVPKRGGEYLEGVLGNLNYLNPLFADLNPPVDRDISRLIFSGLMKYNPDTKKIEDDMATHTLDLDKKVYTFTLKDNLYWHDKKKLTADDVLFTFQKIIQDPDFTNSYLRENFKNVEIKKINEKTVTFTLEKPYKFFLSNLTVGLLPKHILESVPVKNLIFSEFNNINPIGSGPYKLNSIQEVPSINATKVSLQVFDKYYEKKPYIENISFYIFPNFDFLESQKTLLDGISNLTKKQFNLIKNSSLFKTYSYKLSQYVALFFNTEKEKLSKNKARLGLSLSLNKESILKKISEPFRIDTPFLDLDDSSWLLQYDPNKAKGGLNDAGYKYPWKQDIIKEEEKEEESFFIEKPSLKEFFVSEKSDFFIEGKVPELTQEVYVNDYKLSKFNPDNLDFSYKASLKINTLKEGENKYKIYIKKEKEEEKEFLDEIVIYYSQNDEKIKTFKALALKNNEKKHKPIEKTNEINEKNTKYRINNKEEIFLINLITVEKFKDLAEEVVKYWDKVGVKTKLEVLDLNTLKERVIKRDYDALIFGQNLGYNLDSYPYWHSSQALKGVNFSDLKNFEVDTLLESIRSTHNENLRQKELKKLEKVLLSEVPAVFFYAPEKYFLLSDNIKNVNFKNLREEDDRFSNISNWYVEEKYELPDNFNYLDFFNWLLENLKKEINNL
jgi:peptide/nickel transport system substrate-binding protein